MALYWPDQKVAVEIIDDEQGEPFDRAAHPGVTVLQITSEMLRDQDALNEFGDKLAVLLGDEPPSKSEVFLAQQAALMSQLAGGGML